MKHNVFNQLKTAQKLKKMTTLISYDSNSHKLISLIYNEGYIKGYTIIENNKKILIFLKYINQNPVINNIKSLSTCHKKNYIKYNNLKKKYNNNTNFISIILTPKGLMTVKNAIKLKLGGLLLYEIM
jgi:ribosomal protein S8